MERLDENKNSIVNGIISILPSSMRHKLISIVLWTEFIETLSKQFSSFHSFLLSHYIRQAISVTPLTTKGTWKCIFPPYNKKKLLWMKNIIDLFRLDFYRSLLVHSFIESRFSERTCQLNWAIVKWLKVLQPFFILHLNSTNVAKANSLKV